MRCNVCLLKGFVSITNKKFFKMIIIIIVDWHIYRQNDRDTAGQERYETITTQYYRRAQVGAG